MRFFIAFVVVFALIGVTAWLIRRFGSGALSGAGARGRAPRLAVIEAGAVEGRRKLVLIRRDNVEHLIMIGGPSDIVVEANIVRGQNARDNVAPASSRNTPAAEALPRAVSLEDAAWPLQPEPAPRPNRAATRPAPLEDSANWSLQPEQAPPSAPASPAAAKRSRASDTLAGLAAELNVRPAEPAAPAPGAPRPAPVAAVKPAAPAVSAAADNNLADMASRLEAALKRPALPQRPIAPAPRAAPVVSVTQHAPVAPARGPEPEPVAAPIVSPPIAEKPPEPAAPAPDKADNVFGSIEEEMANLLGRPAGKPS
ncbi:MAG: flagellar biosynthetic protein FliO [Tardiphaga sp.]